ncbi:hypothetical protein HZH68_006334 [Vespula germanica]|uniref:Uncharacterized protein n=1 Tax=Vespula germanica TaxID=30212 RepID=A0A834KBL4_VESGE|nr:hypothetical protein HZH68_006334 [Vespula germanica]
MDDDEDDQDEDEDDASCAACFSHKRNSPGESINDGSNYIRSDGPHPIASPSRLCLHLSSSSAIRKLWIVRMIDENVPVAVAAAVVVVVAAVAAAAAAAVVAVVGGFALSQSNAKARASIDDDRERRVSCLLT